jgi:DegV family protein with EDD domain
MISLAFRLRDSNRKKHSDERGDTLRSSRVQHEEGMEFEIRKAFVTGYERMAAWADRIDRINIFPVADGDTGRNLVLSLAPLHRLEQKTRDETQRELLLSSRGISGNIGTRFFSEFLKADHTDSLLKAALAGCEQAWQALEDPRPGTILTLFDALCDSLDRLHEPRDPRWMEKVVDSLERTVLATPDQLPVLKQAGVVDAGALGVFLFFQGFFSSLAGSALRVRSVVEVFGSRLELHEAYTPESDQGYCLDVVLEGVEPSGEALRSIRMLGGSGATYSHGNLLKAHLHTEDRERVQEELKQLGRVVQLASDDLSLQTGAFPKKAQGQALQVVTDSAASVTREDAAREGITLLDSYINLGDRSIPESCLDPETLYRAMREGVKVSTAQASVFERHQQYEKLTSLFPQALYLCVGSVYTGNYNVVRSWKEANDPNDRLIVVDSGLACGKLGLAALATARRSAGAREASGVLRFAEQALSLCQEYIFLDRLQYLAAGGRMSKTSSFFGDLLHMKPVVTPTPSGASKVTVVRNREDQLSFLLEKVRETLERSPVTDFLLQYTDTRAFVEQAVEARLRELCPGAEFRVRPISNTSGVHMGPGTWAVAFLPAVPEDG